jgi:hypothetical protein
MRHQGHVNRVFDEMKVLYLPRSRPPAAGKKMQPLGNIGSKPVETTKKSKTSKAAATAEGTSKSTTAQDVLAKRKAEAAKTILPRLLKSLLSC